MYNLVVGGIGKIFDKLKNKTVITEEDFKITMREARIALLEADVSLEVVKAYINSVKEKIIGQKIIEGISPGQMIIKIVQDQLTEMLGKEQSELSFSPENPNVIMMIGLQGSGKTTTSAKLAKYVKNKNKKSVLLASLDIYRPAAQKQLEVLGKQIKTDTLPIIEGEKPQEIAKRALTEGKKYDVLILDTAGRLQIDETLMEELNKIKVTTNPIETLLVADAVMGQEAVNIAKSFHEKLSITGIILTRIDGDARGGAAFSMTHITKRPIKFVGYGEKIDNLEEFHPERIAKRILNMGDVVSLVEKASEFIGKNEVEEMTAKAKSGNFDFNDLAKQLKTVSKLGGVASIMKMIPGMGNFKLPDIMGDKSVKRHLAIISSMTKKERSNPKIINAKRKKRIAEGAGVKINDINILINKFRQAHNMISKVSKMDNLDKIKLDGKEIMNLFSKK
ncbi:MAG: signal recognition particle protein [Rickettsiaceae bacterium H1]|nr:signal recognition particle protein [Rickettsiaceae bacterium H1]